MEKIVLDANVLYSNTLRGLFLWLHWNRICEIVWSQEIWDEVFRNYGKKDEEKKRRFRASITSAVFPHFPGCLRPLQPGFPLLGLPDADDEHVAALARQEQAALVVTFNIKDFPAAALRAVQLERVHPDRYLCQLLENSPDAVKGSVADQIRSLKFMKPKIADYFASLRKNKSTKFAAALERAAESGTLFPEIWP